MKGDSRIPDAFYWSNSIDGKAKAMSILKEEVLAQIPRCNAELEALEKKRYCTGLEFIKMAIKYEVFLNSIYSLCENLSQFVRHLYHSSNLPTGFYKQKTRFLRDLTIDSDYSKILSKLQWYDEVHAMRTEATHFLSGMVVFPGPEEFGYFNIPKSERQGTPKTISINNIEEHVKHLFNEVLDFLSSFGDHFIDIINQDSKVAMICFYLPLSGRLCVKNISLREYLEKQPGICQTTDVDCPLKSSCVARKRTEEKK
jgi:hypothetical protein